MTPPRRVLAILLLVGVGASSSNLVGQQVPRQLDPPVPPPIEVGEGDLVGDVELQQLARPHLGVNFRLATAEAFAGKPLGVGKIELYVLDDEKFDWREDQFVRVNCPGGRVLHEVIHQQRVKSLDGDMASMVVVHFLFQGTDALDVQVLLGKQVLAHRLLIPVHDNLRARNQRLGEWWNRYVADTVVEAAPEIKQLRWGFVKMLGRRLDLPLPKRPSLDTESAELETQFERSISMLFGFESVRLAMMNEVESTGQQGATVATRALPRAANFARVTFPTAFARTEVEGIALATPQECFYLRCGRLKNYLWVRQLVMGWGGSLNEIVSTPTLDHDVRHRIETQLAIAPNDALAETIDAEITDFALIGYDVNFHEGAGLGVIFEAKQNTRVTEILKAERRSNQERTGAQDSIVSIAGQDVSLISTSDNKVRSFYAVRNQHHLVTNSRHMVSQFLQVGSGVVALGNAQDFQYTHSQLIEKGEHQAFLFLSDAFFRNIISPHYRVERQRRQLAKVDLQNLHLARLAARSEQSPARSIEELVESKFLPPEFGRRADGTRAQAVNGEFVDSLRGAMGTFLPIADVSVGQVTSDEVSMYYRFVRDYQRQWRRVDPVGMTFSRLASPNNPNVERIVLDVKISPYAQDEYRFLTRYLAPSQQRRIAMADRELMGLSARVRGTQPIDVHAGLVDAKVEHQVREGKLERLGDFRNQHFAVRQAYAAVTPQGADSLRQLKAFITSVQTRGAVANQIASQVEPAKKAPRPENSAKKWMLNIALAMPTSGVPDSVLRNLYLLKDLDLGQLGELRKYLTIKSVENQWGTWSLVSENPTLRNNRTDELRFEHAPRPAQVFLRVRDIHEAQVMDYLRAYRFVDARRTSAFHALFLNRMAARLNLEPEIIRNGVESALNARLICPLRGEYELQKDSLWVSSAWDVDELQAVNAVSKDYRFEFLDWLRGLDLEFSLSQMTLHSRMELDVRQTAPQVNLHRLQVVGRPKQQLVDHLRDQIDLEAPAGNARRRPETRVADVADSAVARPSTNRRQRVVFRLSVPIPSAEELIRVTNRTENAVFYEVRRDGESSNWSRTHALMPGRSHLYHVNYPIRLRYRTAGTPREHRMQPKSQHEFLVR